MRLAPRRILDVVACGAALFIAAAFGPGQGARPQIPRTVKIIVPFAPGGGTDVLVRLLTEQIGATSGLTAVVENRPGAGTTIGTDAVSRAAPDGSTLLVVGNALVINPHLRRLSYNPETAFEPICNLASVPQVISVNSASPYHTLSDLMKAARSKPGELTLASLGPGSATQIAFEDLKHAANVDMTFIPYPGNAPAVNALLGSHVTASFTDYPPVVEQYKAGRLRGLASASMKRTELLPDLPTIAESGYADYEANVWLGLFAPAKTPESIIGWYADAFRAALTTAALKPKLLVQGLIPVATCGAEFAAQVRKQYDEYGRMIRKANINVE